MRFDPLTLNERVFWNAAGQNNLPVIRAALRLYPDLPHSEAASGALTTAAMCGHTAIVQLLIDAQVDIHHDDDRALRRAVESNRIDIVRLLLAAVFDKVKARQWMEKRS